MFWRKKKGVRDQIPDSVVQVTAEALSQGHRNVDRVGENVKDFDAAKTAETAAEMLGDLKHKAASTLEKAGLTAAMGAATNMVSEAGESADLGGKAAEVGERTASMATSIRDWVTDMVASLATKTGDAAANAPQAAQEARSRTSTVIDTLMGILQSKAAEMQEQAPGVGSKVAGVRLEPETISHLGRVLVTVGTVLSGLFSPRPEDGMASAGEEAQQAVEEHVADMASVAKEFLTTFAEALITAIQSAEERAEQAIDDAHQQFVGAASTVTQAADATAQNVRHVAPQEQPLAVKVAVEKKRSGLRFFRWLFLGVLLGGGYAYYTNRQGSTDGWESIPSGGGVMGTASGTSYWPSSVGTPASSDESGMPRAMDDGAGSGSSVGTAQSMPGSMPLATAAEETTADS